MKNLPIFQTLAPPSKSGDALSVALVGYGRRGEELLDALTRVDDVHIAAVADIWPWRRDVAHNRMRARKRDIRVYETLGELLAEEGERVDAVIVATPDWLHANHVAACLTAGKHVYCDGELASTGESARGLVRLARDKRLLIQGGHQRRSNPRYIHAFERVCREHQALGRVTHAYAQWHRGLAPLRVMPQRLALSAEALTRHGYDGMEPFLNWEWHRRYGLGDAAARLGQKLDLLRWFWNAEVVSVSALAGYDVLNRDTPDSLMAIFTFRDQNLEIHRGYVQVLSSSSCGGEIEAFGGDRRASLACSENPIADNVISVGSTYAESFALEEYGTLLKQRILNLERTPVLWNETWRERMPQARLQMPVRLDKPVVQPHLENFVAAILGEVALTDPPEQAFANLVVVEGAMRSAATMSPVDFTARDFEA